MILRIKAYGVALSLELVRENDQILVLDRVNQTPIFPLFIDIKNSSGFCPNDDAFSQKILTILLSSGAIQEVAAPKFCIYRKFTFQKGGFLL